MNKFYCKKSFFAEKLLTENGDIIENILLFKEGQLYECEDIGTMWVWYNKNGGNYSSGYRFSLLDNKEDEKYTPDYFYDYFCSIKEYRKLKMNKINEGI